MATCWPPYSPPAAAVAVSCPWPGVGGGLVRALDGGLAAAVFCSKRSVRPSELAVKVALSFVPKKPISTIASLVVVTVLAIAWNGFGVIRRRSARR